MPFEPHQRGSIGVGKRGLDIPKLDGAIQTAGRNQPTIRAEGDSVDSADVTEQPRSFLARFCVKQAHNAIVAACGDECTVGVENSTIGHGQMLTLYVSEHLPPVHIPNCIVGSYWSSTGTELNNLWIVVRYPQNEQFFSIFNVSYFNLSQAIHNSYVFSCIAVIRI